MLLLILTHSLSGILIGEGSVKSDSDKEVELIEVDASELAINGITETEVPANEERFSSLAKELIFSLVSESSAIAKTKLSFQLALFLNPNLSRNFVCLLDPQM